MEITVKSNIDFAHMGKMMQEKFNSAADAFFENSHVDKMTTKPIPRLTTKEAFKEAFAQLLNTFSSSEKSVKIDNFVEPKREIRNHALNAIIQSIGAIFVGIISTLIGVKTLGVPLVVAGLLVTALAAARMNNHGISFDEAKNTMKDYFSEQFSNLCDIVAKKSDEDESSPTEAAPAISISVPHQHIPMGQPVPHQSTAI